MQGVHLPEYLTSGEVARLFPIVPDTQKELKIVSSVLATFRIVPEFALSLFRDIGAPHGKTAKVNCYTEVVFENSSKSNYKIRPDGLLVISQGKKSWSALIEAKSGNAKLSPDQIIEYINLAKAEGIDAIITISNQYAVLPTHHPLELPRQKTKGIGLFHYSWASIASRAVVLSESKRIADLEQAIVLDEIIRFLQHDSSGVVRFNKMSKGWKETAGKVLQGVPLSHTDTNVIEAVASWQELTRFMCLELSTSLGEVVTLKLSKKSMEERGLKLAEDVELLFENQTLNCEFDIPDTAGELKLTADFLRRVTIFSVEVDAPKDKARPTSSINWILRQIPKSEADKSLLVRAKWPRRTKDTAVPLDQLREDPSLLVGENKTLLPRSFEVIQTNDLAGRFIQSQNFVDDLLTSAPNFYRSVVQHLKEWTPSAPKLKIEQKSFGEKEESQAAESKPPTESVSNSRSRTENDSDPKNLQPVSTEQDLARLDQTSPEQPEETTKILSFITRRFG